MRSRALAPLLCCVVLAGCGTAQESTVDEFSGEERQVAQVVADLRAAADETDAAQICGAVLTPQLADRLKAGTRSCTQEVEDALADADEYSLTTREVVVTGNSATARVENSEGRARTVDLVRQGDEWRIGSIRPS